MAVRYFTVVAGESETEHVLEVVVVEILRLRGPALLRAQARQMRREQQPATSQDDNSAV